MIRINTILLMAALGLISSALTAQAANTQLATTQAAKATSIPISFLPYSITTPGTYVLKGNLSYSVFSTDTKFPAILIHNDVKGAVVLDLNGFTITGPAELSSGAVSYGILIGADNGNEQPAPNAFPITVRNGSLTNFTFGVDASQLGLTHITLDHLTVSHPALLIGQTTGLYLSATASTVSDCNLLSYGFGINITGSALGVANNTYKNNTFTQVTSPFFMFPLGPGPIIFGIPSVTEHLQ
jgi:hypothetical protein